MIEMETITALNKPSDLKICSNGFLNWYSNEICIKEDCGCTSFDDSLEMVNLYLANDYAFYKNEGYSEDEIDHILIEV